MKILSRIFIIIFLCIFLILIIEGFYSVYREIKLFKRKINRNALVIGHAMRNMVQYIWEIGGQDDALEMIQLSNKKNESVKIKWVWLDALPEDIYAPSVSKKILNFILDNPDSTYFEFYKRKKGNCYTYIPVKTYTNRKGAIEISESLINLYQYIYSTIFRTIILISVLLFIFIIVMIFFGYSYLGKPLSLLIDKTKRIGSGDLTESTLLKRKDELYELNQALNVMCRQLSEAREALRMESKKRITMLENLHHTERLATIGQLSAGIAHELGTPLNIISGISQLLIKKKQIDQKTINYCQSILKEVKYMTNIIQQLLDFARPKAKKNRTVNIYHLIKQVIVMLKSAINDRIKIKIHSKDNILINIDQFQIQQVIINILMNAIQSMNDGGNIDIEFQKIKTHLPSESSSKKKDFLNLSIKDEGEGISKENIKLIFDPFFTTKDVGKGTGLGLSIVYRILNDHGGWIDVESKKGKGSKFLIYLPLEKKE